MSTHLRKIDTTRANLARCSISIFVSSFAKAKPTSSPLVSACLCGTTC